jgi:hypothetical protein
VDAIATIAAETIVAATIALEVDPTSVVAVPAAALDSNAAPADRIVTTAVIPDLRAVLSSSPRC